jgi:hypothetical protein
MATEMAMALSSTVSQIKQEPPETPGWTIPLEPERFEAPKERVGIGV